MHPGRRKIGLLIKRITGGIQGIRTGLQLCPGRNYRIVQPFLHGILPQEWRIQVMSLTLAIVPIKEIKTLFIGYAIGQRRSQAPFPDHPCGISGRF